ncbi:MAG: LPS export ABC transporter periplasmic protein LptC [Nitrosomonadales bacterium]|nr:LPS export ABC transporter periplasmic protein LptC [Nitrosomonadales bacterium]
MLTGRLQRLREWTPLLPLLLLLAGTYWLNQQVSPLAPRADGSKRHDPDFIVSKFSAVTLNEQGTPRFIMSAQNMLHYPDNDSTHIEAPLLSSLYPDKASVYTSAREGEISSKGDEIFLRGDVKMVRAASATQSAMSFTTDYLHIVPERDLADTDRTVTLMDAHNSIHATGMRFDSKARTIKLLAQVTSQHETAKR